MKPSNRATAFIAALTFLIVIALGEIYIARSQADPTTVCQEDQPCWNPCTMGNHTPCTPIEMLLGPAPAVSNATTFAELMTEGLR